MGIVGHLWSRFLRDFVPQTPHHRAPQKSKFPALRSQDRTWCRSFLRKTADPRARDVLLLSAFHLWTERVCLKCVPDLFPAQRTQNRTCATDDVDFWLTSRPVETTTTTTTTTKSRQASTESAVQPGNWVKSTFHDS